MLLPGGLRWRGDLVPVPRGLGGGPVAGACPVDRVPVFLAVPAAGPQRPGGADGGAAGWQQVAEVAGYLGDRHPRVLRRGAPAAGEKGIGGFHGLVGDCLHLKGGAAASDVPSLDGVVVGQGGGVELAAPGVVALPGDRAAEGHRDVADHPAIWHR